MRQVPAAGANTGLRVLGKRQPIAQFFQNLAVGIALTAVPAAAVAQTGQTAQAVQVPPVVVSESAPVGDGTAANGYRVDTAPDVGPWGAMPMLNAPYSVLVEPKEMLENTQTVLSDQFYERNPFTQLFNTTDWGSPNLVYIRGFHNNSQWIDGLESLDIVNNLEDKESAEIITGLSGFFYGPASIGGIKDFTLKRPTLTPLADFTAGYYGGAGYFHADLGGPIDPLGQFAYRLNVVAQDGGTPVDFTTVKRNVISGALDWHVTNDLLIQFEVDPEFGTG
jgi:iron complex outermembrane receptor protein